MNSSTSSCPASSPTCSVPTVMCTRLFFLEQIQVPEPHSPRQWHRQAPSSCVQQSKDYATGRSPAPRYVCGGVSQLWRTDRRPRDATRAQQYHHNLAALRSMGSEPSGQVGRGGREKSGDSASSNTICGDDGDGTVKIQACETGRSLTRAPILLGK